MTMKFKDFCNRMRYTWKHKVAFLKIEHELLGRNTFAGYLHDLDKILIWYPVAFISQKDIKSIKSTAKHHFQQD